MRRLLAARLAAGVGVMWGAATITFFVPRLAGGSPVTAVLGPNSLASPAEVRQVIREYGFDQPLIVQYLRWLGNLLRGDLGQSYQLGEPVSGALAGQILPTVELAGTAVGLALVFAVAAGVATTGRGRWRRELASNAELVLVTVPTFWIGLLALTFVSFRWHLLPGAGATGAGALILPAVVLALPIAGILGQVLREGLEDALAQPWALSVRARGVSLNSLVVRHALRHAAASLATMTGLILGSLFGGTVLIETVFARPGLGTVLLSAVTSSDYPVMAAVVLIVAAAYTVMNVIVDILYLVIDPRIGASAAEPAT